jgi:hypothetical protein
MNIRIWIAAGSAALGFLVASPTLAAGVGNGDVGRQSRATVAITASVAPRAWVRSTPVSALPGARDFCLAFNTATQGYALRTDAQSTDAGVRWIETSGRSFLLRPGEAAAGLSSDRFACIPASPPTARLVTDANEGSVTLLIVPE